MNEALSELYIEDEDHEKLRESVDDYDNFDQVRNMTIRVEWTPPSMAWRCLSSLWRPCSVVFISGNCAARSIVSPVTSRARQGGGVHECHPPTHVC